MRSSTKWGKNMSNNQKLKHAVSSFSISIAVLGGLATWGCFIGGVMSANDWPKTFHFDTTSEKLLHSTLFLFLVTTAALAAFILTFEPNAKTEELPIDHSYSFSSFD